MPPGQEVSFDRALARVSEVRGLKIRGEVHGLRVNVEDLLEHVKRAVALETPEHALHGTEAMLVGLGLVPQDFDYKATMLRLLSEKLAGLYDPHLKTMMIRSDLATVDQEMTLLHELVHALQDQYYDLEEIVAWTPDDTDRSAALSALAEGDATSAMFDGILEPGKTALSFPPGFFQERMSQEASDLTGVPPIITRSLKAPYVDGLTFVHELRARGGFAAVDEAWRAPPTTTEQILHFDKYEGREPAVSVPVPAASHRDARLLLSDVWGEQNLRMALEEWVAPEEAKRAAAGWGGDRVVAYERAGVLEVAWHIVMDSEPDARELHLALMHFEEPPKNPEHPGTEDTCRPLGRSDAWAVSKRSGKTVFLHAMRRRSGVALGEETCAALHGWISTRSAPE